jgi:hypothetical protein
MKTGKKKLLGTILYRENTTETIPLPLLETYH